LEEDIKRRLATQNPKRVPIEVIENAEERGN
jgi:hypothetical protein